MAISGAKGWFNIILIRMNKQNATAANIDAMSKVFKKYNPGYPVEYKFVDVEYAQKFNNEKTECDTCLAIRRVNHFHLLPWIIRIGNLYGRKQD
jgi:hypothetical protein